ncbi:MAG: PKD domain-containing protein [Planctomycetota bacterium]|nr:PKD domain-containing protein [Planctomycetota bacterium]
MIEAVEPRLCLSDPAFNSPVSLAVGSYPTSTAIADLNADGKLDIVAANTVSNTISVLLGRGDGSFQTAVNRTVGSGPMSVAVADFNADGKLDLVTANQTANTLSILLGNGDGSFRTAVDYADPYGRPFAVSVGDLNADGHLDLITANNRNYRTAVLLGRGDGTFNSAVVYVVSTYSAPFGVTLADFNTDGKLDVAIANYDAQSVSLLFGNGNGTLQPAVHFPIAASAIAITHADLNGDGLQDLITANSLAGTITVLLNNPGGAFSPAVAYVAGLDLRGISAADLNQDGYPDIIVADMNSSELTVFLGNGDGTLQTPVSFTAHTAYSVSVGDLNGDGRLDLVAAAQFNGAVNVLLAQTPGAAPVANPAGPYSVNEGATVSLNASASSGTGLTYAWDLDGDGIFAETGAAATRGNETGASPTFSALALDGPSTTTVSLRVTDSSAQTSPTVSATINITNVPPTLTITGNPTVNEGATYSLTLASITDPGNDTVSAWTINWGDGASNTVDEDGTFTNAATKALTVANVPPTLSLTGNASTPEGSSYTLTLSASDAGSDTISAWTVNWGDGTSNTYANGGAKTHIYPDNTSYTISASATDEDATYNANSKSITVTNLPPTLVITGNPTVNEGATYSLNLAASDPGADTISSWLINWGDSNTQTLPGNPASITHIYLDNGAYTISASATDEDATYNANSKSITVNNLPPTTTITGNPSVNEGDTYSLTLASITDPGADTVSAWTINWGDGQSNAYSTPGTKTHLYTDGPLSPNISVTLADEDGTYPNAASKSITVNNLPRTATITGATSATKDSLYSLSLASSDPGADTVSSWTINWGDSNTQTLPGNPSSATHTYTSTGSFTITAYATDEDATVNANSVIVAISLTSLPTLTITGNPTVNEGDTYTLNLSSSNPVVGWLINWGENNVESFDGSPSSITHTYPDNGAYTITAFATDPNATYAANPKSITVNNLPPTLSITGNASVNEGATYSLTLGSITDPGADTVSAWTINWGDGQSNAYSTPGTKTHLYTDGPLSPNISVTLADEDGTHPNAASKSITDNNLPPTLSITGNSTVNEGATYSLNLAATDPGSDSITSWIINWGDGNNQTLAGNPSSVTHTYPDNGAYTISATATDEDATYAANSKTLTVMNVAPTTTITANPSVNEGDTYSLTLASSDPGADTISAWTINWGDGQSNSYTTPGTKTHLYTDGPLSPNISVTLADEDGTYANAASKSITVNNLPPTTTITANPSVNEGDTYSLTLGSINDPGADTVSTWTVNWGDGRSNSYSTPGTKIHVFTEPAPRVQITVSLVDEDGTYHNVAAHSLTVNNIPPTLSITGPSSVYEGMDYTLNLSATPAQTITLWTIDWGDDTAESVDGDATALTHTYVFSATCTITATATDTQGTYNALAKNVAILAAIPAALANTSNVSTEAEPVCQFTLTYTDMLGIDTDTLDGDDILVTGPNGYSQLAELLSLESTPDAKSCSATYQIYSPGPEWVFDDNGTYTLTIQDAQVANIVGQTVPTATLNTFTVNVPQGDVTPPVPSSFAAVGAVTGGSATLTFKVTYTDDTAITDATLGDENILVTGPKHFQQLAQFISATISLDGKSATATYRIAAPGGFWDPSDNGNYTFQLQSDQVADDAGNYSPTTNLGAAIAKLAPDRIGTSIKKPSAVRIATTGAPTSFYGYVMGANTQDYFRFPTTKSSKTTAQLSSLVDKAQVQILNSKAQILKPATSRTAGGTYFTAKLPAGTYYLRVILTGKKGTGYRVQLSTLYTAPPRASKLAFSTTPLAHSTTQQPSPSSLLLGRITLRPADLFNANTALAPT